MLILHTWFFSQMPIIRKHKASHFERRNQSLNCGYFSVTLMLMTFLEIMMCLEAPLISFEDIYINGKWALHMANHRNSRTHLNFNICLTSTSLTETLSPQQTRTMKNNLPNSHGLQMIHTQVMCVQLIRIDNVTAFHTTLP